jgi:hypothetical protein
MNQKLCVLVLIASASPPVLGIEQSCRSESDTLLKRAHALSLATVQGDATTVARHTHPFFIRRAGGRPKFAEFVKSVAKHMKDEGYTVTSFTFSPPLLTHRSGANIVCLIPIQTAVAGPPGQFIETGFLVAVRDLAPSSSWVFFGSSGLRTNPEILWEVLPDLPRDVQLPPNRLERAR